MPGIIILANLVDTVPVDDLTGQRHDIDAVKKGSSFHMIRWISKKYVVLKMFSNILLMKILYEFSMKLDACEEVLCS